MLVQLQPSVSTFLVPLIWILKDFNNLHFKSHKTSKEERKNASSEVRRDIFYGNQHPLSISLVSSLFPAEWKLSDRSSRLDQSEAGMRQFWPIRREASGQSLRTSGEKFVIVLGKISFLISAGSQSPPPQSWTQTDLMTTLTTPTNTYTTSTLGSKLKG